MFYSVHGERPVRLSARTRAFAQRTLSGGSSREIMETMCVVMPGRVYTEQTVQKCYADTVRAIAEQAPVRLDEDELFVGSATLGLSLHHCVPVKFEGCPEGYLHSVSHTTAGFARLLEVGYDTVRAEVLQSLARYADYPEKVDFLEAALACLDAADWWHGRYMAALEERIAAGGEGAARWRELADTLRDVPRKPPQNFRQAVQALWMMFSFLRLCGNWPAIGRIDRMLWPFLERDLGRGAITMDEAREYIAHFWIKGCEWVRPESAEEGNRGSGDGQNYQNIVLSGSDADGRDMTNPMTYLVLEVVEELGIAEFPVAVRLSPNRPRELTETVARVMRYGGGAIAVYNDATVISALEKFGYPHEEAVEYANDGCWEVLIPGKTQFGYAAFDMLRMLQVGVLQLNDAAPSHLPYNSLDELLTAFAAEMDAAFLRQFAPPPGAVRPLYASPLIALTIEGCIEKGIDYLNYGAVYDVYSPHAGGLADVAGALQAIDFVVWQQKLMSLDEFMDILKADWAGHEELRLLLRNHLTYFGNGDPAGDAMMRRVFDTFLDCVSRISVGAPTLHPAGVSTFGRQGDTFLPDRFANADGHHCGEILSGNINPTPGADRKGFTALLRSVCGLDLSRLSGGTALSVQFLPKTVEGDEGLAALADTLDSFCDLGGFFMQCDMADAALLRAAQANPEQYAGLTVRVSGWNARWNTLDDRWQRIIIDTLEGGC